MLVEERETDSIDSSSSSADVINFEFNPSEIGFLGLGTFFISL